MEQTFGHKYVTMVSRPHRRNWTVGRRDGGCEFAGRGPRATGACGLIGDENCAPVGRRLEMKVKKIYLPIASE
jgi:hypothetical protein